MNRDINQELEEYKKSYAKSKKLKDFDGWVDELLYWQKNAEVKEFYADFAKYCIECASSRAAHMAFGNWEST